MNIARRNLPRPLARAQRGVVLMIALIVLVALTLAGLSMVRSADTGVIIAGNLSFRQSAAHALDAGVENAIAALPADLNFSSVAVPGKYYAFPLPVDAATGLPQGVDWTKANVVASPAIPAGYTVRYIVERLCTTGMAATVNPADVGQYCNVEPSTPISSNKIGGFDYGQVMKLHYNVTVKVEGPRNTETYAQALVSR